MRKKLLPILLIIGLLLGLTAQAQQANLSAVPAVLTLPEGVYAPILLPDNLEANAAFITAKGSTLAAYQETFKQQGILLEAHDEKNARILVVSAISDADGQNYMDIDQQTPAIRAQYRAKFQKGSPEAPAGYTFDTAEWKNFPEVGRFLMGRYTYRENGAVHHRGYMRRSVKNGLTITIDLQVYGRGLKGGDNTALNQVFDTLKLTGTTGSGLTLPVVISETQTVPKEAYEPGFRMKGTTRPGATLRATVMSYATNKADVYNASADAKGAYSLDITLPAEGFYMITMDVEAAGLETLSKQYTVTYAKGLLPVTMTATLPAEISLDSYKLTGTTLPGVTVQMIQGDKNTTRKTGANGTFSFTVATKEEGLYDVKLVFSKKDFNTKTLDYSGVKGTAATEPLATQPPDQAGEGTGSEAITPPYTDLIAQADSYDGKLLTYHGFVTKTEEQAGDWIISLALRRTEAGYADTVLLVATADPGIANDSEVIIFGTLVGINADMTGDPAALGYPRIQLNSIQAADGSAI
ncbi:MAG: hypothetical protein AB9880_02590 [Christensenellales bacterium]